MAGFQGTPCDAETESRAIKHTLRSVGSAQLCAKRNWVNQTSEKHYGNISSPKRTLLLVLKGISPRKHCSSGGWGCVPRPPGAQGPGAHLSLQRRMRLSFPPDSPQEVFCAPPQASVAGLTALRDSEGKGKLPLFPPSPVDRTAGQSNRGYSGKH